MQLARRGGRPGGSRRRDVLWLPGSGQRVPNGKRGRKLTVRRGIPWTHSAHAVEEPLIPSASESYAGAAPYLGNFVTAHEDVPECGSCTSPPVPARV
jgi:hypothetical protein